MSVDRKRSRRDFVRDAGLLAGGAAAAGAGLPVFAAGAPQHDLVVVSGEDPAAMVRKAIAEIGGMKRFVSRGDVVVIKPNMAFERRPDQGASTHPDLMVALIEMVFDAGAKEVKVFDHTVQDAQKTYPLSGIPPVARKAGAQVFFVEGLKAADLPVPNGRHLKKSTIYTPAVECDCYINVPIAKHHHGSQLTLSMKNHMGVTADNRQFWHKNLDQAIPDFASAFKAHLNVLDAYRVVYRNGPRGGSPGDVKLMKKCIVGLDQAAVDAYGATLHDKKPTEIRHIAKAGEMGVGEIDLAKLRIHQVEA